MKCRLCGRVLSEVEEELFVCYCPRCDNVLSDIQEDKRGEL